MRSCHYPVKDVEGQEVITIEGLAAQNKLHSLQEAFIKHDAFQCGYCTLGMIMSSYSLLLKKPHPSKREIIEALDDNLCRCGAHNRIISAVITASKNME